MKSDERRVSDLALAAYLALRHPLVRIEASGGGRAAFVFTASATLEADAMAFLSRRATVEPLAYSEQIRFLKGATP